MSFVRRFLCLHHAIKDHFLVINLSGKPHQALSQQAARGFQKQHSAGRVRPRDPEGRAGGKEGGEKPLLTPGLYDNVICVWWLRVWKALCPIRSVQQISTCPWQRWSGSFRRHCGSEPVKRAQTPQVEQAEINEHHKPHLFNTGWHPMNIPSVKLFHTIFHLPKLTSDLSKAWTKIFHIPFKKK